MGEQQSEPYGVEIRRQAGDDFQALHDIYAQPGVIAGTLQMPYPSKEVWRQRAATTAEGSYNLVAELEHRVVGSLGLWVQSNPRRAHSGTIAMAVHDAWQGRGVGTALMKAALDLADGWLGLGRLELQVFVDNEAAIRLYRGCGFSVEGTLEGYALRDGVFVDVLAMARLRRRAAVAG